VAGREEVAMGLATLNVWVHDPLDPCRISDEVWWVAVTYCNGNPVEWCGHTYSFEAAKCGHAEFQLPPGCYIVRAFQFLLLNKLVLFRFSEHAIVIVNCDDLGCVHLYNPTYRQSPIGAARAVRFIAESEKIPAGNVERFVAATDDILKNIPERPVDAADERLVQHLTELIQKKPPE
jgi:hypothetical protein